MSFYRFDGAKTQELPSLAIQSGRIRLLLLTADSMDPLIQLAAEEDLLCSRLLPGHVWKDLEASETRVIVADSESFSRLSMERQAELLTLPGTSIVMLCRPSELPRGIALQQVFACVGKEFEPASLLHLVQSAARAAQASRRSLAIERELLSRTAELSSVSDIGIALMGERDHEKLLRLILRKARELAGCDAGSLYLLETGEDGSRKLVFRLAQNDSIRLPEAHPTPLPLSRESLAGYVAVSGEILNIEDAYHLPENAEYRFDRDAFDGRYGYRTKSVLMVPMTNVKGERLGVLQLINRRRRPAGPPLTSEGCEAEIVAFPKHVVELMLSLAGQAAICIENNRLYGEVRSLFEGFVKASVTAIEQRDPTTSGHSFRVAAFTTEMARVVQRADEYRFRDISFTPDQMKEIRYAALLHDFGKVAVPEQVLVKGKKLYPERFEILSGRFDYAKKWLEAETWKRLVCRLAKSDQGLSIPELRLAVEGAFQEIHGASEELDEALAIIRKSNEPTVLPEGHFEVLGAIASRSYEDPNGTRRPLLTSDEVRLLSIRKGSLDDEERRQIEDHVTQTYRFLVQIPWTREFRRIPDIAYAHHEKLTGTGYPRRLPADAISIESRMMTVSDIYDALTASDRPYKKAVPRDRALAIIEAERDGGLLDADLVRLFIEAKVYEATP